LYESGIDFILLEGSDQIGGRVKHASVGGYNVEMGANWIHSPKSSGKNPHNTMWRYKNELEMEGSWTSFMNFKLYSEEGENVGKLSLYEPFKKL
jgi:polyamine oxidase